MDEISRTDIPDESQLGALSDFFRIFGDQTRLRILYALAKTELCVCDLAKLLGASQSAVSHQLQVLRSHRLVKYRREGKTVFYSLDDGHIFRYLISAQSILRRYDYAGRKANSQA